MRTTTLALACLALSGTLLAQTEPAENTADLYTGAAALIVTESPSASNFEFPGYPPMGDRWRTLAEAAWRQNLDARERAREANATPGATWPPGKNWRYLNNVRELANELGDAAQYRGLEGDLPAALGFVDDVLDLSDKLRAPPLDERIFLHTLIAAGIDALAANRITILAPELGAAKAAPVEEVKALIARLLEVPDATPAFDAERAAGKPADGPAADLERARQTFERIAAERRLAAMSLACQLYRRDKGGWPARADDLVPAYLPSIPPDPAGDGKSPLGYALIAKGLPDGGDRPLVYSRLESRDGLAYRTDEPQYGFYGQDGSDRPSRQQRRAGQFRDVARWAPAAPPERTEKPTLAPLP